jgi:S-adenosylmethionine decarboxylase
MFRDLAPTITRQRLIIEGYPPQPLGSAEISAYLLGLSAALDMRALMDPATHRSPLFGWAGWVHWETSGAHFYAWEQPILFFSVDIYTCKQFSVEAATDFTSQALGVTTLVWKEIP